jgi:hypothetical protein
MASKDFENLMDLLEKQGRRIESIKITIKGDGAEQTHISFRGVTDTFSSKEPDVVKYAFHLKQNIDSDGNYEIVAFKDLGQYYEDIHFLVDKDGSKQRQAYRDLVEGRHTLDFDPDQLIEEFLLSHNRESKTFLKLKTEHFYVAAYFTHTAAQLMQQYEVLKSNAPEVETYHDALDRIYMKAFRSDPNYVKNYIQHHTMNDFDLMNFAAQVRAVTQHTDLMQTFFPHGGMPVNQGIQLVLDTYRRYAEACVKPLNLWRIAQEIAGGDPSPRRTKSAGENKAILQPVLGSLLDCYDPRVRNAESHLSTEVDAPNEQVLFYKEDKRQRRLLVQYSFAELVDMTNRIQRFLLPALVFTAVMEWRASLLLITDSREYKLTLLKIGN